MGKMKEVFQLQQEMIMKNHHLKDMPDSYFIELYLQEQEHRQKLNETKEGVGHEPTNSKET